MPERDETTGAGGIYERPVFTDRRSTPRQTLPAPRIALLRLLNATDACPPAWGATERPFYVDVHDCSADGLLLRSMREFPPGRCFQLCVFGLPGKGWACFEGRICWARPDPKKPEHILLGCTAAAAEFPLPCSLIPGEKSGPFPSDYEFFRTVPFLKAIHRDAVCPLLNSIRYRMVKAGTRFIRQGEVGDVCYIVQSGACRVLLEKRAARHAVGTIKEGEFVGEMALLTGEPRSAHVEALCDMELWSISRDVFEQMLQADPEVGTFLTEIVAERFASRKLTADRQIGKYVITDILGRGAFAIVYNGTHADLNRPVAIKMLRHDMAMNPEFLANFRKEARTIAGLNHENIVKVFDIEERFRTIFIIMERLEGRTLREVLDEVGCLPVTEAVSVVVQVCRGLQYAHERSIVHQDIKPGNLFLHPDGKVKILDFGLACPCGSENPLTGTPYYMSPEQVECLPVDERADIFALGLTAFEMVAGRRPFDEKDPLTVMDLIVAQDIPDPAEAVPGLPDHFGRFIRKACSRDPALRFRDAGEAMAALEPLTAELGLSPAYGALKRHKLSTLFLMYREDQRIPLNRLMEDFSEKAKQIGVVLRAADFKDI
jgi:tRNA A-37 threonylcarbamoyl transferase component Bud32